MLAYLDRSQLPETVFHYLLNKGGETVLQFQNMDRPLHVTVPFAPSVVTARVAYSVYGRFS